MAARIRRPGDVLSMVGVLSFSLRLCDMKMKVIKKGGRAILRENAHFTNNFHLEYFRIIPFLMTSYMSATLRLGKVADLRAFAPKGSLQSSMGAKE